MPRIKKPKILVFDIETLPMLSYHWGLWQQNITPGWTVEDASISAIGYKWLGEPKTNTISLLDNPSAFKLNPRNDKHIVEQFAKIVIEADAIITMNGKQFDVKWINRQLRRHRSKLHLPDLVHYDLKILAKKSYRLEGYSLAYMARLFKTEQKGKVGGDDFIGILKGDVNALKRMVKYCAKDLKVTEEVFELMRADFPALLNLSLVYNKPCCPSCGSNKIQKRGKQRTRLSEFIRLHCQDCGAWSKAKEDKEGNLKVR